MDVHLRYAALAAALACVSCRRPRETPPPPVTAPARALLRTDDGITREVALQVFARLYGPVPGVAAEPPGAASPVCGTEATRWVAAHWSSLTPPQQEAVRAALQTPAHTALWRAAEFVSHAAAADLTAAQQTQAQSLVDGMISDMSRLLGHTLRIRARVYRETPAAAADSFPLLADSERLPTWVLGLTDTAPLTDASVCRIRVRPEWLTGRTAAQLRMVLGHELFHCFQFDIFRGTRGEQRLRSDNLRPWAFEGAAAWFGERFANGTELDGAWLDGYFADDPAAIGIDYAMHRHSHRAGGGVYALYLGGYDAIGFFDTLLGHGRDPLALDGGAARVLRIVNDASSDDALATLIAGDPGVLADVASASTRMPWGTPWDVGTPLAQTGPGKARAPALASVVSHGAPGHFELEPGTMQVIEVPIGAAPFVRVHGSGAGHVAFDASSDERFTGDVDLRFCRSRPCACPDGSPVPGVRPMPPGASRVLLAHMGPPRSAGSTLDVETPSAEDLCAPSPPDAGTTARLNHCLDGVWHIDKDHERAELARTMPSTVRLEGVNGDVVLDFDTARGTVSGDYRRYCIDISSSGRMPVRTRVIANGPTTGRVSASGAALQASTLTHDVSFTARVQVAGTTMNVPLPIDRSMVMSTFPSNTRYRCTATSFEFEVTMGGTTRMVRYHR